MKSSEEEGIIGYRCKSSPVAGEEDCGDAVCVLGDYVLCLPGEAVEFTALEIFKSL